MYNLINKILKSIYVYFGFRVPYAWAEILFPNRIIYCAILLSKCYTMKQFKNKNERLLEKIDLFDDTQNVTLNLFIIYLRWWTILIK